MEKSKYFLIPIPLMRGLLSGEKPLKEFTQEVVRYSLYYQAVNLSYCEEDDIVDRIEAAADFLNVSIGNPDFTLNKGKQLYERFGKHTVHCGVTTQLIWDYCDNPKSNYQIAMFCAFCATRSSIGKSKFRKTNKNLIIARMFGYTTYADFAADKPNIIARNVGKDIIEQREKELCQREKYSKRYHIDKVLTDLELSWGLKRYADHVRGMFISYTFSLEELAVINEKSKRKDKLENLKEAKKQAKEKAKGMLNSQDLQFSA